MISIAGFPPIAAEDSKILILGSMPSQMSLQKQQYYGHQRNAFWPIMLTLLNKDPELSYRQRQQLLIQHKIAVWDVLQSCYREGSLDTAIKMDTITVNDFHDFFCTHEKLKLVCFNGAKAEALYNKHVMPAIKPDFSSLKYIRLPSTSPAHAAMNLQQKTTIWMNSLKEYRL